VNILIFIIIAADLVRKTAKKEVASNSFQKKSIISIMKKQEKLLHSSEKKMKKDTIKNTSLLSNEKKSVIKFEQDKTSLNKIWPPQFFLLHVYMQLL